MRFLSDKKLIKSYHVAVERQLEERFIHLLEQEIARRNINTYKVSS